MSKYNKGDKFVIEIDEVFNNGSFGEKGMLYKVKGFNTLVFDEYGLDKLTKMPRSESEEVYVGDVLQHREDKEVYVVVTALYDGGYFDAIKISCTDEAGKLYGIYSQRPLKAWRKTGKHYNLDSFFFHPDEYEELPYS